MMKPDLIPVWKALSDPTRRHILDLLRQRPHTTGELSAVFEDISRYAVMKHLKTLEDAELILIRRRGRERYNHLNAVPLQHIYERWLQPYEQVWAESLTTLKKISEETHMSDTTNIVQAAVHRIEQEIVVDAPVSTVYQSVLDVNGWWAHRMSAHPDSLRLEAKVGGRFWETEDGSDKNGTVWGMVTSLKTDDHIQLSGAIGIPGAITGNVVICTIPQDDGTTKITLSHHIMGDVPAGYIQGFTEGWQYHLGWLKKLSETGDRVPPPDFPDADDNPTG